MKKTSVLSLFLSLGIFAGYTHATQVENLVAFAEHIPKSILVLPPINESPDIHATNGYWPTVTVPLAEAGYYVFPIAVVDKLLKENGVSNGYDAQSISADKLRDIFGADTALYLKVKQYGSKYQVIQSVSLVEVEAKLVDLNSGALLWEGRDKLQQSSNDNSNNNLVGMLVGAVINQISNNNSDYAHVLSGHLSHRLYTPDPKRKKGLLYGPRSPNFTQTSMMPSDN